VLWPLEGTAVGLLAGATARCVDETAAPVVDVAPRTGLADRRARSAAVLLLAAVWTAAVLHAGDGSLFGHRNAVWLQGIGATAAGGGLGCWRRARGEAMPGLVVATAVVPAATAWALVRPLKDQLAMFPYGTTSPRGWEISSTLWGATGLVGAHVLAAALAEVLWRRTTTTPS
jgi:hypothetical protein